VRPPTITQELLQKHWDGIQIFLGSNFDAVDKVKFFVTNTVFCFGMDEFYIDQAAPPNLNVPEPISLLTWSMLAGMGVVVRGFYRRQRALQGRAR